MSFQPPPSRPVVCNTKAYFGFFKDLPEGNALTFLQARREGIFHKEGADPFLAIGPA